MPATKNLCAQIDLDLHQKISEAREQTGQTTSQYITDLLTEYFKMKENGGNEIMTNGKTRTLAFQIDETLFQRIKDHLVRESTRLGRNFTQREFVIGLIEQALAEAESDAQGGPDASPAGPSEAPEGPDEDEGPGGGQGPALSPRSPACGPVQTTTAQKQQRPRSLPEQGGHRGPFLCSAGHGRRGILPHVLPLPGLEGPALLRRCGADTAQLPAIRALAGLGRRLQLIVAVIAYKNHSLRSPLSSFNI